MLPPSRPAIVVLAAVVLLAGGCATASPPPSPPAPPAVRLARLPPRRAPTGASADEARMLVLVNRDRAANALPPLVWDERLAEIARDHDDDMIRRHYVGHVTPDGLDPEKRLRLAHYLHRVVRENIAVAGSVEKAEVGLMHSPEHRENLLATDVTRVGIGIRTVPLGGGGVEVVVTQDFARPFVPPTPTQVRDGALIAIAAWRRRAGKAPLPVLAVLQRLADTAVKTLTGPFDAARLHEVAENAAVAIEGGGTRGLTGVSVSAESLFETGDIRVPKAAMTRDAVGLGVATTRITGSDGQPRVVVLVLVGQGR